MKLAREFDSVSCAALKILLQDVSKIELLLTGCIGIDVVEAAKMWDSQGFAVWRAQWRDLFIHNYHLHCSIVLAHWYWLWTPPTKPYYHPVTAGSLVLVISTRAISAEQKVSLYRAKCNEHGWRLSKAKRASIVAPAWTEVSNVWRKQSQHFGWQHSHFFFFVSEPSVMFLKWRL